jgi:hypothetical protein
MCAVACRLLRDVLNGRVQSRCGQSGLSNVMPWTVIVTRRTALQPTRSTVGPRHRSASAVASPPQRGSSMPGAAVLVSSPSRPLWCLLLPDVSAAPRASDSPIHLRSAACAHVASSGLRPATSSGLRSSHLGGADSRAIGGTHARGRAAVGGCGSPFDPPAPPGGAPGAWRRRRRCCRASSTPDRPSALASPATPNRAMVPLALWPA